MTEKVDDREFVECIVKYEGILKAYARSMLPTWDGVEEVLQNSYLIIWRKWEQLQDPSEFLPWSKTILRFETLKYRRNKATDRHVLDEDVLELIAKEGETEEAVSTEEKQLALQNCLSKLKKTHQNLLLSHYNHGQPLNKLAQDIGKSSNSLYKLMGRLRVKLQDCIETNLDLTPQGS